MIAKVCMLSPAQSLHRLQCGECGWELSILAETSAPLEQCPWCGWEDLAISVVAREGVGQHIRCSVHGEISVQIPGTNIGPDDLFNDLFCPFCKRV